MRRPTEVPPSVHRSESRNARVSSAGNINYESAARSEIETDRSALLNGHVSFASVANSRNCASESPGTLAFTVNSIDGII